MGGGNMTVANARAFASAACGNAREKGRIFYGNVCKGVDVLRANHPGALKGMVGLVVGAAAGTIASLCGLSGWACALATLGSMGVGATTLYIISLFGKEDVVDNHFDDL